MLEQSVSVYKHSVLERPRIFLGHGAWLTITIELILSFCTANFGACYFADFWILQIK